MESAMVDTLGSSTGSIPRRIAPLIEGCRESMASVSKKGAAPTNPGAPCSCSSRIFQSGIDAPLLTSLACAETLNNLERNSDSKPFMTDNTMMTAATPTATPNSETQVMKETKKPCPRGTEYRKPTNIETGWNTRNFSAYAQ